MPVPEYKVETLYSGTKVDTGSFNVHTIFVSFGQSTAMYSLLSARFKKASVRAKWSNYVHSHISSTQSVNTTPFCANTQALVARHLSVDRPKASTVPVLRYLLRTLVIVVLGMFNILDSCFSRIPTE